MSQKYVLPPDVVVRSAQGLPPELRSRLGLARDERVLMRPHSRDPAAVVDAETESLIELFRTPHTIEEAVIAHSEAHALEPVETLRQFFPALTELVNGRVLVGAGSILAAPIELCYREGDLLAGFEILLPVHLAADTEVYLARGPGARFLALKVGRPGHEAVIRKRLALEARALTLVGAEVAPELLADGALAEVPHLALAWCAGVEIDIAAADLRSNGGGDRHLVELVGNVLSAFATLHGLGLLHGDVSPRNVLADAVGKVKLIDFGLARLPGSVNDKGRFVASTPPPTPSRLQLGSQASRLAPTAAGEQYSVAAMVYALLTGAERQRFTVEQDALVRELAAPEVRPFAEHDVVGLSAVEEVVGRALSRDSASRFDSITAFRDAFESAAARDLSGRDPRSCRRDADNDCRRLADEVVARLTSPEHEAEIDESPASTATGAAGLAYALLRLAIVREDELLLANADVWARRAVSRGDAALPARYSKEPRASTASTPSWRALATTRTRRRRRLTLSRTLCGPGRRCGRRLLRERRRLACLWAACRRAVPSRPGRLARSRSRVRRRAGSAPRARPRGRSGRLADPGSRRGARRGGDPARTPALARVGPPAAADEHRRMAAPARRPGSTGGAGLALAVRARRADRRSHARGELVQRRRGPRFPVDARRATARRVVVWATCSRCGMDGLGESRDHGRSLLRAGRAGLRPAEPLPAYRRPSLAEPGPEAGRPGCSPRAR